MGDKVLKCGQDQLNTKALETAIRTEAKLETFMNHTDKALVVMNASIQKLADVSLANNNDLHSRVNDTKTDLSDVATTITTQMNANHISITKDVSGNHTKILRWLLGAAFTIVVALLKNSGAF
jgi:hypothetical protein